MPRHSCVSLASVLLLFVLVAPHLRGSSATFLCPEKCACDSSAATVNCTDVSPDQFMRIFAELAATSQNVFGKVAVRHCQAPLGRIMSFPTTFRTRVLDISGCGITSFESSAFKSLAEDLIELRLANNSLTSMPVIEDLRKLEALNLNMNSLDDLPDNTFVGMEHLSQLRLKSNKICSLPSGALAETKGTLELLDLGYNCLTEVPASNLRNTLFLKHLDLSGNRISVVKDVDLMNLPELREIRLNANNISQISPRAFVNVASLTHLYLKDNELVEVDSSLTRGFQLLNVLDLSGNRLQKIPVFKDMPELKLVYLQQNRIAQIDAHTFSNDPKLQLIALQNNAISTIAPNSFESLSALTNLLLANNSITSIDAGTFDGMSSLATLSLRNNSISTLTDRSFSSLPQLRSLDLSQNRVAKVPAGVFSKLKSLVWLDLSDNNLTTLERGSLTHPIGTILLGGNALVCDAALDWFITYLVQYNIRTFLPAQPEVQCAAPPKWAGHTLKDLMMKKANDTLNSSIQQLGLEISPQQRNNFLANLLPALVNMGNGGASGSGSNAPILGTLTQAIPSLRSLSSGWNGLMQNPNSGDPSAKNLEAAVEQFAEPLVRFSTGAQPAPSDVGSLIKAIPNLVVNLPGYGNIDVSKVHPKLIEHVMNGGTIPGVSKESMDSIVRQIMLRVYAAAAQSLGRTIEPEIARTLPSGGLKPEKYLRPLKDLPPSFVTGVMQGRPLPHLTVAQTEVVKDYYMQTAPKDVINNPALNISAGGAAISPTALKLFNLLPRGYNMSKLPPDVIQSVMRGELPDITRLPLDLQLHIRDNWDQFVESFGGATPDVSVEDILKKLPKFDQPDMTTFAPYDINDLDAGVVIKNDESSQDYRLYLVIALGVVSVCTLAILAGFCVYVSRAKKGIPS